MQEFDVIILGGGPAGLSIASVISKKLDILLVEKGKIGETTKAWATWKENAKRLPIVHKASKGVFSSYQGAKVENRDALTYTVDDHKILSQWKEECARNNATMLEHCAFLSFRRSETHITAVTTKGRFRAQLIIDATGPDSPIIKKHFHHPDDHYWSCFGYVASGLHFDPARALILDDLARERPRPYFMYFPISKNSGVPIVFYLGRKRRSKSSMKRRFLALTKTSAYAPQFKNAKWHEEKWGYIPLRPSRANSMDRILFVGDAAGWAPPITGCGFNKIIEKYDTIGKNIISLFDDDNFSEQALCAVTPWSNAEQENSLIQSIFYYLIINSSDKQLNQLISLMARVNKSVEEDFIKAQFTPQDIRSAVQLIVKEIPLQFIVKSLPAKEYKFIIQILAELVEDEAAKMLR